MDFSFEEYKMSFSSLLINFRLKSILFGIRIATLSDKTNFIVNNILEYWLLHVVRAIQYHKEAVWFTYDMGYCQTIKNNNLQMYTAMKKIFLSKAKNKQQRSWPGFPSW